MSKAIVIGSGIAGIAAALRLKKLGYEVEIYETNSYTGGKLHVVNLSGYRWDAGPSLFTMPQLVSDVIELFTANSKAYFEYTTKENVCNYFWEDGTRFNVTKDLERFIQEASSEFNEDPKQLKKYLEKAKIKYDLTKEIFLERSLHRWSTYLNIKTLLAALQSFKLDLFQNLNQTNRKAFKNKKLIQLFNRYATYNGSSPYQTPGIMSMIPHLEMYFGTFFPKGGMHEISQSLTRLATDQRITIHLNNKVKRILHKNGKAIGIETQEGEQHADIVICNMDVFSAYHQLLPDIKAPERTLKQERSSSALIFYWGIKKTFPELDLHNIFFSDHYEEEFKALFETKEIHVDPTVYVNITCKEAPDDAPEGHENWFVLMNVEANPKMWDDDAVAVLREQVLAKIERTLGARPDIVCEQVLKPQTIESLTGSWRGALYGASSNSAAAAFLRHRNRSTDLDGLYFCGGSVHPGGGIPLCLLGARIVDELAHA